MATLQLQARIVVFEMEKSVARAPAVKNEADHEGTEDVDPQTSAPAETEEQNSMPVEEEDDCLAPDKKRSKGDLDILTLHAGLAQKLKNISFVLLCDRRHGL